MIPINKKAWVCSVCDLKNIDENSVVCDLCGAKRGVPKLGEAQKRASLAIILKMKPEEFDPEIQEKKRIEALKNIKGVFGVPLKTAAPRVLCDCIAYITAHGMNVEGIFRVPGEQDTVDALKAAYEKDENRNVLQEMKVEPHDVGTLFKLYFRMMPEPLIPTSHYDLILDSVRMEHKTKEDLINSVNKVANSLPSPNKECLGLILTFLKQVAANSEINKMTPANLATCFAPSLLRAPETSSAQQALMDMSGAIGALNILIKHPDNLPQPSQKEIKQNTKYVDPNAPPPAVVIPPPGLMMKTTGGSSVPGPPPGLPGNSVKKSDQPPPLPARASHSKPKQQAQPSI